MAEHSVWATSPPPGTPAHYTDGGGSLYVANAFYKYGAAGAWNCVGARLYVPVGTLPWTGETPVTLYAWLESFPSATAPTWASPNATATLATLVEGWNEVHWTGGPLAFNAVDAATGPQRIWIGYKTADGNGYVTPSAKSPEVNASDSSAFEFSEDGSVGGVAYHNAANSIVGTTSPGTIYGVDLLLDDGVSTGITGTLSDTLPSLTASLPGTVAAPFGSGTLTAILPSLTASLAGTVTAPVATGTLSTTLPKLTASISDTHTLTVAEENVLTDGVADKSFWMEYSTALADELPGFARSSYYAPGQTLQLSVDYDLGYTVQVWRLGWYGGDGARKMADFTGGQTGDATSQPAPAVIPGSNGAVTCAAWAVTDEWTIPADATPGMYWVLLSDPDNGTYGKFGGFPFVVTDTATSAAKRDVLVVTSDGTWHAAYNGYGGNNVYGNTDGVGTIETRALCSSYDKPIHTRLTVPQTNVMNGEYATLRFLERCGINVGYATQEQITNDPTVLDGRSMVIYSGHNEYISATHRDKIQALLAAGVNVANFAANDFFWKVRYGGTTFPTSDASVGRVMWVRKDTMDGPTALGSHTGGTPFTTQADWTGTWQDTRRTTPQPPGQLFGDRFIANGIRNDAITVPASLKDAPIWRNCPGIQALASGQTFTFGAGTLGMEWDMPDDTPGALSTALLSSTTVDITGSKSDANGQEYDLSGSATHAIQMVRNGPSHVVNFNTTQWGWALDDTHDRGTAVSTPEARQATLNVLTDLGAVPDSSMVAAAGLTLPTPVADIDTAYAIPTGTPTVTGAPAGTLPKTRGAVTGTVDVPHVTGTVDAELAPVTGHVTGTAAAPAGATGHAAATLPKVAGHAAGTVDNPEPTGEPRDITITAGPITGGWAASAPATGWLTNPPTGDNWTANPPTGGWTATQPTG